MAKFFARKIFTLGYWIIYFSSLIDGATARDMLMFVVSKITKTCYWCEIAGIPDKENTYPVNEPGGFDASSGRWICEDCADQAESVR